MIDDLLPVGIWQLCCRSRAGDLAATALERELRRLYTAAGEPVPVAIRGGETRYDLLDDGYTVIPSDALPPDKGI